jgi:alkanesulfonate monooxygenase SsuD/methylene tetrahydromethanopterin reductase-like flavin-dependent oxidoreductase (luciferase family)
VRAFAKAAGRDPMAVAGAMYLTVALDENAARAEARLNSFLERYYLRPAAAIRSHQSCYAGPAAGMAEYLDAYAKAGAGHLCIRFAGEHETHLTALAKVRSALGW